MDKHDILASRVAQQHDHLRSLINIYINWYTFFWPTFVLCGAAITRRKFANGVRLTGPEIPPVAPLWSVRRMVI